MKKLEKNLKDLLEKRVGLLTWLLVFLSMIFLRSFVEQFLAVSKSLTILETLMEFIHNAYFFCLTILLVWLFLSLLLRVKPQKLSYILIFSMALIIVPPFIDMLKINGQIYWSFYLLSAPSDLWKQYITIFGHLPSGIVYFGTKIVFLAAIFSVAVMTWIMTKSLVRAVLAIIGTYSVVFFMSAFPSFFYYAYVFLTKSDKVASVHSFEIAAFFSSPEKIFGVLFPSFQYTLAYKLNYIYFILLLVFLGVLFYLISRKKFIAVLKNLRLPQVVYHCGIFLVGMGLGFLQYRNNFRLDIFSVLAALILLISVVLSWVASVVVNDLNDIRIDEISNADRPLPKNIFSVEEYFQFGVVCFFLAVLGGITIGLPFAVLLVVYQVLAWFYSAVPFRLKKFPIVATFVSAAASLIVLSLGFILMSDNQTIHTLSWRVIFLLLLAYTLSLPLKDFKDIEGDKEDGVWTIPVIFGEKKGRLVVSIGVFICYVLSVFVLNEMRLFFWSMIFGAVTFLVINNEKIKPRNLPAWVLGIVCLYSAILVGIIFG